MKILLLGHSSYIGGYLSNFITETIADARIVSISREQLDFSSIDIGAQFANLVTQEEPDVIINCIGGIDSGTLVDAQRLFISNFLPTFLLFDFFKENPRRSRTLIIILGSNAAGEPRKKYPLYAATKGAELALSRTAQEVFDGTPVNWKYVVVPRLKGGLGSTSHSILELDADKDQELLKIGHLICDIIMQEKLLANSENE